MECEFVHFWLVNVLPEDVLQPSKSWARFNFFCQTALASSAEALWLGTTDEYKRWTACPHFSPVYKNGVCAAGIGRWSHTIEIPLIHMPRLQHFKWLPDDNIWYTFLTPLSFLHRLEFFSYPVQQASCSTFLCQPTPLIKCLDDSASVWYIVFMWLQVWGLFFRLFTITLWNLDLSPGI